MYTHLAKSDKWPIANRQQPLSTEALAKVETVNHYFNQPTTLNSCNEVSIYYLKKQTKSWKKQ